MIHKSFRCVILFLFWGHILYCNWVEARRSYSCSSLKALLRMIATLRYWRFSRHSYPQLHYCFLLWVTRAQVPLLWQVNTDFLTDERSVALIRATLKYGNVEWMKPAPIWRITARNAWRNTCRCVGCQQVDRLPDITARQVKLRRHLRTRSMALQNHRLANKGTMIRLYWEQHGCFPPGI